MNNDGEHLGATGVLMLILIEDKIRKNLVIRKSEIKRRVQKYNREMRDNSRETR